MPTDLSALVEAAARLDDELRRYEALADEVGRASVHSRKSLVRVARMLQQGAESHEELMKRVASLSEAMTETRSRQAACAEKLVAAGGRLQERMTAFQALVLKHDALGELSRSLNAEATAIAGKRDEKNPQDTLAATGPLLERMEQGVVDATSLADAAREADFTDLARDVDQLKQQLQSARNQLLLARRALGERSPS